MRVPLRVPISSVGEEHRYQNQHHKGALPNQFGNCWIGHVRLNKRKDGEVQCHNRYTCQNQCYGIPARSLFRRASAVYKHEQVMVLFPKTIHCFIPMILIALGVALIMESINNLADFARIRFDRSFDRIWLIAIMPGKVQPVSEKYSIFRLMSERGMLSRSACARIRRIRYSFASRTVWNRFIARIILPTARADRAL